VGKKTLLTSLFLALALGLWWGYAARPHHPRVMAPLPEKLDPAALSGAGAGYQRDVLPLFKAACFDCHTTHTVWPWYHAIPGVRQFIEGHVDDGRRALDLTPGFPFDKGSKLLKDLRRIAGNVQRKDMPLDSYQWMHPEARLTDDQRATIVHWAQDSFDRLTTTAQDRLPAPANQP
jgi:hypothetical protein